MLFWLAMGALAAPVRFDRVDLVSESPGTWLLWEAPRLGGAPATVALRWAEQVAPVVSIGRLELSTSLQAQSIGWSIPLHPLRPVAFDGGVVARAFLPVGVRAGLGIGIGRARLGISAVALSDASWSRLDYTGWTALPALGFGVGRRRSLGAPWMR